MQFVEVPPFRTTVIGLFEGDRFVLSQDSKGGWVDWPNLYCVASLRPTGLSLRAMRSRMDAVCQFHNWAALRAVDVQARIEGVSFFPKEEVEALRQELRVNLLTRPATQAKGGRR